MTLEPLVLQNTKTGQIHRVENLTEFSKITGLTQNAYFNLLSGKGSIRCWESLKLFN